MLTDPERQAAEQLCERIDEKLEGWGPFLKRWRQRRPGRYDSLEYRLLGLDGTRLVIRRLLAETDDD